MSIDTEQRLHAILSSIESVARDVEAEGKEFDRMRKTIETQRETIESLTARLAAFAAETEALEQEVIHLRKPPPLRETIAGFGERWREAWRAQRAKGAARE